MDKQVKFAVYTSFYNCYRYVDQIFESVLSIDYDDWKWFITDDFSTDGTGHYVKEKCKGIDRIEYVEQVQKKEMYWQPNKFIQNEYEYILLVCSDDKVDSSILKVYDSVIRKNKRDISVLTCDLQEIYEEDGSLKSIGYVLNSQDLTKKLDSLFPTIDYVNNLGHFLFGLGMCFKNYEDLEFEINDFSASAEDFYRIFYMSSIGKWAHVPRNLYTWTARKDSESRKGNDSKFHENFSIAFDKCKDSLYEPIYDYNSCYKELSSLLIENNFKNFSGISIISPWISEERKNRILEIYPDKNVAFNSYSGSDLYSIIANYTLSGDSLVQILEEIKLNNNKARIIVYFLDENIHYSNDDVSNENIKVFQNLRGKIDSVCPHYYFFLYFRHINFVIDI